jgi:hypothetical protein
VIDKKIVVAAKLVSRPKVVILHHRSEVSDPPASSFSLEFEALVNGPTLAFAPTWQAFFCRAVACCPRRAELFATSSNMVL